MYKGGVVSAMYVYSESCEMIMEVYVIVQYLVLWYDMLPWAYSIFSELVSITPLFFKMQQVQIQPVVVTINATVSSPTTAPKAGTSPDWRQIKCYYSVDRLYS